MSRRTITIKHKISTRHVGSDKPPTRMYRNLIRMAVNMTLNSERVDAPCVVGVLITDDKNIRMYNNEFRNIDKATDVLSFPMQDFTSPGWSGIIEIDKDLVTDTVPLGDIVISAVTIKRNARKHGVSIEQETAHMIIHSCLHLLGYDHSMLMSNKEKILLMKMGY